MVERVRKVVTRRGKRVRFKFPSLRQRRTIHCESPLEFDYAHLLEFDHGDVLSYREQPAKITYWLEGEWHRYTPDFLVNRRARAEYVEVKSTEDANREENRRMFRAVAAACAELGYGFVVAEGDRIREQPRFDNVKLLCRYATTPLTSGHQIICHQLFAGRGPLPFGRLCEIFAAQGMGPQVVYSLIYWGVLGIDLGVPLTDDAPVFWPEAGAPGEGA